MRLRLRSAAITVLAAGFPLLACRPSATENGNPCDEGAAGCACVERTECEAGLECSSGVCLEPSSSSTTSAAGTGLASTASASGGAPSGIQTSSSRGATALAAASADGSGSTTSSSAGGADGNGGAAGGGGTMNPADAATASSGGGMAPHLLSVVTAGTGTPFDQAPEPTTVEQFVGEPCSSFAESLADHPGSHYLTIAVGAEVADCGDLYCIANRFQGRVSCPYGQTYEDIQSLPDDHPARCRTPEGEPVTVEVDPQLVDRRAEVAMVCSCRCDGDDPEGDYCSCPSGTECADILPDDLQDGFPLVAGSFCIPNGSAVSLTEPPGAVCDRAAANCGGGGDNP